MHMSFVKLADSFAGAGAGAVGGRVMSPMPGKVVRVAVEEGAVVKQGQLIMILEAMKVSLTSLVLCFAVVGTMQMEHMITAPVNGIVQKVFFSAGDIVQEGAPLAEVQPGV
jgi:biotin carboxyl carrier protein